MWLWIGELKIVKEMLVDVDGDVFGKEEGKNATVVDAEILEVSFHGMRVVPSNVNCWMEEVLYLGLCLVNGIVKRIVVCEDNGMLIGGVDGILKEMLFILRKLVL